MSLRNRILRRAALALGVMVLVALNYYLRHSLEHADQYLYSFLTYFYPDATRSVFSPSFPKWKLLLPLPEFTGSWTTTTLILTHLVQSRIGPANAWYLFNAILIVVSFFTSWVMFKSWIFSYTFAICMGFGTQLYHTYSAAGGIGFYLLFAYYQVLLMCAYKVVIGDHPRWVWRAFFGAALIVTAIAYEAWLDLLVFIWIASIYLMAVLWRVGDRVRLRRLMTVTATITVVGLVYIYVKTQYGYGQLPGKESDLVFNYHMVVPAIEDVISNVFTHGYVVLTNFLPPALVSSNSFYQMGAEPLIAFQYDYATRFHYLVPMSHVFFWRYYAGVALTLFVLIAVMVVRRSLHEPTAERVTLAAFIIMTGIGGPTHDFIKYRPMNSMPVLGYHVLVGVLGMSLLISFGLDRAVARVHSRAAAAALVAAVWGVLFYGALARPTFLSHEAAQVGLGEGIYPDPMRTLRQKFGLTNNPPGGLVAYRLAPVTSGAHVPIATTRAFGANLARLPIAAPDVTRWTAFPAVKIATVDADYQVEGNAVGGYQLLSPAISVPPQHRVLLRVEGTVERGRVCIGALDQPQQRWLLAPEASAPEFGLDTGNNSRIWFVFTDCRTAREPDASRFTVRSITYAVLKPAGEYAAR
jgi:hypothetical protein